MGVLLRRGALMAVGLVVGLLAALGAGLPTAAAGVVTNCNDSGTGSLRAAVADGGAVTFQAGLNCSGASAITLTSGTLTLSTNVTIDGSGAAVAVDGNNTVGVFQVSFAITARITGITIQHGGNVSFGGGIYNAGTLTVTNSTLSDNSASSGGGGILNQVGTLTVRNSTFSTNNANLGGGILNSNGTVAVTNSTFASNTADTGGGIYSQAALTVTNSTFSGNSAGSGNGSGIAIISGTTTLTNTIVANSTSGGDLFGSFSATNNLIDDASGALTGSGNLTNTPARLGTLGNYGGPTQTFPLLPGSAALDAYAPANNACGSYTDPTDNATVTISTDQRGIARPQGSNCDIGAFEARYTLTVSGGGTQSTPIAQPFPTPLAVTLASADGVTALSGALVTFTAPATGASATFTGNPATTDASGKASVTATANSSAGAYSVTASTPGAATPATFSLTNQAVACVVNSTQDPTESGKTTLRRAVTLANGGGCTGNAITFDLSVFPANTAKTITLDQTVGALTLRASMTIDGTGHQVAVSGGGTVRVLMVNSGATVGITALTIRSGNSTSGGGIANQGTLTVTNSTFSGNRAIAGGGIFNASTATVINSTFSGNTASDNGGGITNTNAGTVVVTNSTFSGNDATVGGAILSTGTLAVTNSTFSGNTVSTNGGGILNAASGTLTLANTIVTGNTPDNVFGSFTDGGHNLTSGDALLGPLGNYGGPTQTLPLLPGSPAIDAGDDATCNQSSGSAPVNKQDQRGVIRPHGAHCDIGAFESQGFTLVPVAGSNPQSALVGSAFPRPLALTVTPNNAGEAVNGGFIAFAAPTTGASATLSAPTATIASGQASVTATANLRPGGPYSVTASAAGATTTSFALTNTPPIITLSPASLPTGTAEQFFSQQLAASGGTTATYTFTTISTLPTGITLSAAGLLSGTPTQGGTFPLTIIATDGNSFPGSQQYSLIINGITVTLAPTTLPAGVKGIAYTTSTLSASSGTAPYTFSAPPNTLPPGLSLASSGTLSGTPTATGPFTFTVTATDKNGFTGTQQYSVTITAAPLTSIAVTCAGSATPSVKVGQTITCSATGTYQDGSTQQLPAAQVTWHVDTPADATVDANGNVLGVSPGTPQLTVSVGSVSKTITIIVVSPTPIGIAPAPGSRPGGATSATGTPLPVPGSRNSSGSTGSAVSAAPSR